jgi:cation transport regulator ChaC
VFGYGSLVWRPAFDFVQRVPGSIQGFARRFWQASPDHRGVPGDPGRVVTLVPTPDAVCHGVAFEVAPSGWPKILAQLDHREQNGYARHRVTVRPAAVEVAPIDALVYIATADNPSFRGGSTLADIAAVVRRAHGPSGSNREYVARLAEALAELEVDDAHVRALVAEIARQDGLSPSAGSSVDAG